MRLSPPPPRPLAPSPRSRRDPRPAIILAATAALATACVGYDATPPPAAKVSVALHDIPAAATATVTAYDESDKVVGSATIKGGASGTVTLTADRDFAVVRVVAVAGEKVLKGLTTSLKRTASADLGKLTAATTTDVQLVQAKVAGGAGALASVPPGVVADLVTQVAAERKAGGAAVGALDALVAQVLAAADTTAARPVFEATSAKLGEAFAAAHAKVVTVTDYESKLAAAAARLKVNLVCDAAMVKVMFTVDVSGEALDGNGARQLVRQPVKGDKVYLAITVDDSSPVADAAGLLKTTMTPNDPATAMVDDGTGGDEKAGDGVYTRVLVLPRGMRVKYKYTNGSGGEGWTRTEEWPGNARLLEVRDVLSRNTDGTPDCLVIRRDAFGDEATNKNFVNLHSAIKSGGGTLSFDKDLGGVTAAKVADGRYVGGLNLGDVRTRAPLTPKGLAEALENGTCTTCPPPLTLDTNDTTAPTLQGAEFVSTERVKVSFSEAMEYASASFSGNYLVVDSGGRALAVKSVAASGSVVHLGVAPPDFAQTYTLHVKNLKDASARANPMAREGSNTPIAADSTPPQVVSAVALPLRDFNPGASSADPTLGQVVRVTFDEELDRRSAENVANYRVSALAGKDLTVRGAFLKDKKQVWLITDPQGKRKPYDLNVRNVRDLAGNLVRSSEDTRFAGFALFKVTFGAVPGHAFLTADGSKRGLPSGSKLYLTGTVLSVARDLKGNPIGVSGRTDVTGIPEFEMKAGQQLYKGQPVYTLTVLAPPGTYAWKVAHGVAGEYTNPPATLVKVHKSLATTLDATAVNIDPATLTALPLPGADGKPVSFLDYKSAKLSLTGGDAPGPFTVASGATLPRPPIMFKRENPDEVCGVTRADKVCTPIVVGTWRDIDPFVSGGKTDDYDDGLLDVDPTRLETDVQAPKLRNLLVRDSQSLLLTFDERLQVKADDIKISAKDNATGKALPLSIHTIGTIGGQILPHQVMVCVGQVTGGKACDGRMDTAAAYTLTYDGFADVLGNKPGSALTQSFTAPSGFVAFSPLADNTAPRVISVQPKSPTGLVVQFDEKVLSGDATNTANYTITAASGTAPTVSAATLQGGGTAVHLTTSLQAQQASYTLVVSNIRDLAQPPNTLKEQKVLFKGFGDAQAPKVVYAAATGANELVLAFDEPLSPLAAAAATSYAISGGVTVTAVTFSGDASLKSSAFDAVNTRFDDDVVVLTTTTMKAGQSYTVTPSGVADLSGNKCTNSLPFKGVAKAPTVDVIFTYTVSATDTAGGKLPGKAISPAQLAAEREGVFVLGATLSLDGKTKGDPKTDTVTSQLGGFPAVGQALSGIEPQLKDDGQKDDKKAGDSIYTLRIKDVPLGTSLQWKAFASYQVGKGSFADATPGPAVYQDGQEYPGNENGVRILGDKNGDGVVWVHSLFGDEVTFKKFTDSPSFVWVVDDVTWKP